MTKEDEQQHWIDLVDSTTKSLQDICCEATSGSTLVDADYDPVELLRSGDPDGNAIRETSHHLPSILNQVAGTRVRFVRHHYGSGVEALLTVARAVLSIAAMGPSATTLRRLTNSTAEGRARRLSAVQAGAEYRRRETISNYFQSDRAFDDLAAIRVQAIIEIKALFAKAWQDDGLDLEPIDRVPQMMTVSFEQARDGVGNVVEGVDLPCLPESTLRKWLSTNENRELLGTLKNTGPIKQRPLVRGLLVLHERRRKRSGQS